MNRGHFLMRGALGAAALLWSIAPGMAATNHAGHPGAPVHGSVTGSKPPVMQDPLGLTDAQKARIKPIQIRRMQQMQRVWTDPKIPQAQKMARARQEQMAMLAEIRPILTVAQRKKLDAMLKGGLQGHPMPRRGMMPRPGAPH